MDNSGQAYRVYSPSKIYLSPTARAWATEWGMSDAEMAQYLIDRHRESGDAFANDVGTAAGRDDRSGFPPQQDAFEGDVGVAPGRNQVSGFPPQQDAFAGDVGTAAGRDSVSGFPPQQDAFAGDVATEAPGRNQVSGFPPAQTEAVDIFAGDVGQAPRSKRFHNYLQGQAALDKTM